MLGDAFILVSRLGQVLAPLTFASAPRRVASGIESEKNAVAFVHEIARFENELDDVSSRRYLQPKSSPLTLAGSEDLDAVFRHDT